MAKVHGRGAAVVRPRVPQVSNADLSLGFKSANPEHYVKLMENLDFSIFEVDPAIQRDEQPGEINKIVRNFNPDALGIFTISIRTVEMPDGSTTTKWILLDGQQRRAALSRLQWDGKVRALVHFNLSASEEARLFLDLNERNIVNPWDRFKNRLIAEEPQALAIRQILEDLNIGLGGPNGFSAISRADRIYARGTRGPANLRWALQLLKETYGRYDGRVMEALAFIYDEYFEFVDPETLKAKLLHNAPTINKLTGNGTLVQQLYHCTVAIGVAEAIIAIYNKHTRTGGKTTSALPSLLNRKRKPSWRDREELARMNADDEAGIVMIDDDEEDENE